MVKIVIVEKNKSFKTANINKFSVDTLYKKCKFSSNEGFMKRTTWELNETTHISVYAKDTGRVDTINKFDFPPPIDKELYYGKVALVAHSDEELTDDNIVNFTKEEWEDIYEHLLGGIEDLNDDETRSSEEEVDPDDLTKEGYFKDGFVVSDEENKKIYNSDEDEDYKPDSSDDVTSSSDEDKAEDDDEEDEAEDDDEEEDGDTTGEESNSELEEEEYV